MNKKVSAKAAGSSAKGKDFGANSTAVKPGPKSEAKRSKIESSGEEALEMFASSDEDLCDDFGQASDTNSDSDGSEMGSEIDSDLGSADLTEDEDVEDAADMRSADVAHDGMQLITNSNEEITDIAAAHQRIQRISVILSDYKSYSASVQSEASRISRPDLGVQFARDLAVYYGYNAFMIESILKLFPKPMETIEFLEANEVPRPVTIRVNTLKTRRRDLAQALTARGVQLQPLELPMTFAAAKNVPKTNATVAEKPSANAANDAEKTPAKDGKKAAEKKKQKVESKPNTQIALTVVDSTVPIGATPEYMAGQYMLQTAASLLPVLALAPQAGERVLDMSAAPGGKSTHIAAAMGNAGVLFSNDKSATRSKALVANIHRMGVQIAAVTCMDGREIPSIIAGFDRVLLDAPCSGSGVAAKDASVKTSRTAEDVARLVVTQKELLLAAIDAANVGGTVVYSTCSILVEENEAVVAWALKRRPNVRLVETGLDCGGRPGFANYCGLVLHPAMRSCQRFYPHTANMDGFFVAKLSKIGPTPK